MPDERPRDPSHHASTTRVALLQVSLDKILCGREFNNLRNFLRPVFCEEFQPCSTACGLGWVRSFGCFTRVRAC